MNKTEIAVAVLLVIMVAAVMYVQRPPEETETLPPVAESEVTPAPPVAEQPEIRYPVETPAAQPETAEPTSQVPSGSEAADQTESGDTETAGTEAAEPAATAPPAETLPALDDSDAALREELDPVLDMQAFARLFQADRLIRRFVVSVDNLPNRMYPRSAYRVARSVPGQLVVRRVRLYPGDEETLYLNPDNYARYTPYVRFFTGLNSKRLVMVYRHFYPLFQAAYEDLGYPSAYFNDRLVDVIDNLLATPEVRGPVKLVRPHVLYQYADPDLEALSAGQKVLIRVGPENAASLKDKLRELHLLLTGSSNGASPSQNPSDGASEQPKV